MLREDSTQKLIEYIQTFPLNERKFIAEQILEPEERKNTGKREARKQKVLNDIKSGLLEIEQAKRSGKKLKSLDEFLKEI